MAFYFSKFPEVVYNPPVPRNSAVGSAFRSTKDFVATDISARLIIKQLVGDPNLIYYDYAVKDGERADIIAEKYYGDSRLDWVIMMYNQVLDPYFEWPRSTQEFESYIRQRYGSIASAQAQVNRYEKRIHPASVYYTPDGDEVVIAARYVTVDKSTYDATSANQRREIDQYTHENNLNEAKRNIKILDENFIGDLVRNYRELFE